MMKALLMFLFVLSVPKSYAGPFVSGGGMDKPYLNLKCGTLLQARFYKDLPVPDQGTYKQYIYLTYMNSSVIKTLMSVSSDDGNNLKFTILDQHPYCLTSITEVNSSSWMLSRNCEGQIQDTNCEILR